MRRDKIVCTLGVCTDLAAELVRRTTFNTTEVNLCENFESFVCDEWRKEHTLRPDQGSISYDNVLQDRSNDVLRGFLEGSAPPIDTPADRGSFGLVKEAYDACMNQTEVRRAGISPVAKILGDVAGLFTVNETAYVTLNATRVQESDGAEMRELLLYFQKAGLNSILDIIVGRDDKDPVTRIVQVQPPASLTLSKDYYADNATMASYLSAMTKVLAAVHPSEKARANAEQLARQVISWETQVLAVVPELEDMYDVNKYYNVMSLTDTNKLAPIFGIEYAITKMSPPGYKHDRMITAFPDSIQKIAAVLLATSKETIQTFFMWRVLDTFQNTVLANEIEPYRQFRNELAGRDPTAFPDRWRTCVRHASDMDGLGWIMSRFYSNQYFSEKGKELGEALVTYVKNQYIKTIKTLDWLDESVKAVALQKLDKMGALMGFPDQYPLNTSDPIAVQTYYKDVKITTSFFDNVWSLLLWSNGRTWSKFGTPYDRYEWQMTSQTVNAYNDPNSNVIAFPAAILQVPYFNADIPSYLNFGATGWTVGHEVSHSFDNHGREYDADGRYGSDWWTNRTATEFRRLSQCFVDQYGNYSVTGLDGQPLHLDGQLTLGENIADAGGIDTAFLAWQQHRADHPEQDTDLPGLEKWTHEQLYFIGFANSWCSMQTRQALIGQVFGDEHSPARFRVKGSLENSKYFKQHFNCPTKEPKCKIW